MSEHIDDHEGGDAAHPWGAWLLTGMYLLVVIAMWIWVYGLLLTRG